MKPPWRDFSLEVYFSQWEFNARYNLAGSDIQSMALAELLAMANPDELRAWEALSLGYTETYGAPALREAIAETYSACKPENVLCFAGAEEGIYCAMHALLRPQDHAIVCYPNYQSAESIPLSICEVSGWRLAPERDWSPDLDELRSLLRPNTRLISINFPHNPTGKMLEREKFDELVDLCRQRGLWLFSDEVYRRIEREPAKRLPQGADVYERALSLNVMSKAYGLAGLRIGWIACQDKRALLRMERLKHYLSICNSAPSEALALIALRNRDRILEQNRNLVDRNLALLEAFFAQHRDLFEWQQPDGSSIAFPRYLGAEGVEAFTRRLVEKRGVILLPASLFRSELGPVPPDHFRIGYGRAFVPQALEEVEAFLTGE